ncbi:hypothetical protein [Micromonospora luteifusca]|uniref:hypothetical protein n=1 Tax=Micromonospora luteifusca TaxID=709860 RepID=UPI0033BA5187
MTSRRWVIFGMGLVLLGAGLSWLISYLVSQGLERASWWATVISLFVSAAGLIVAVLTWRRPVGLSAAGAERTGAVAGVSGEADAAADRPTGFSGSVTALGPGAVGWAVGSTVIAGDHNVVERSRDDHS